MWGVLLAVSPQFDCSTFVFYNRLTKLAVFSGQFMKLGSVKF